ncbi:MAG: FtsX-like permease family protein [Rhodoglobus sp.]
MIRLLLSDLRANVASRLGPLVTVIGAAITLAVGITLARTNIDESGSIGTTAIIILTGTIITSALVLSAVQRLAVDLRSADYALWQVAGVLPSTIGWIVLLQSLVVALVGAVVGSLIADQVVPLLLTTLWAHAVAVSETVVTFGIGGATVAILMILAIVLASSIPAALRAARTPALSVLRESTPPSPRMHRFRWVAAVVTVIVLVLLVLAMSTGGRSQLVGMGTMLSAVIVALAAAVGPLLYPAVLRGWTSLIPARVSPAWYLARHNARHKLGRSTAAITPMMVAVALSGGAIAVVATATNAIMIIGDVPADYYTQDVNNNIALLITVAGAPVAISLLGSAVVVFVTGRDRYRDNALLRASGATDGTIVKAAAAEALIHAVTAYILGVASVAISAVIVATIFMRETNEAVVVPYIPLLETGGILVAGLVLILVSTVVPTLLSLRADVPAMLSAE